MISTEGHLFMFERFSNHPNPGALVVMGVAGVVAIFLALKIGHFVIRMLFGLAGLALLAGGVAWLFLHH
jgi:hypothetical protein